YRAGHAVSSFRENATACDKESQAALKQPDFFVGFPYRFSVQFSETIILFLKIGMVVQVFSYFGDQVAVAGFKRNYPTVLQRFGKKFQAFGGNDLIEGTQENNHRNLFAVQQIDNKRKIELE